MERSEKTIENLEQELDRIKEEIERRKKEAAHEGAEGKESSEKAVSDALKTHIEETPEESLGRAYALGKEEIERHIRELTPEEDDGKIEGLFKIAMERGVINAVRVSEKLNNPHILDDFHRRLVYYFNYQIEGKEARNETNINYLIIGALAAAITLFILFLLFKIL